MGKISNPNDVPSNHSLPLGIDVKSNRDKLPLLRLHFFEAIFLSFKLLSSFFSATDEVQTLTGTKTKFSSCAESMS